MLVGKNTVVTIDYELSDASGKVIEKPRQPISYLHGGYRGIFPRVEDALDGKGVGDRCEIRLEPGDAFGEYDAQLVRTEPRNRFPGNVKVGMQFEGAREGSREYTVYTVTGVARDEVVVDGNHPLAGKALVFNCTVTGVRTATGEELTHGHVHGPHGHHH